MSLTNRYRSECISKSQLWAANRATTSSNQISKRHCRLTHSLYSLYSLPSLHSRTHCTHDSCRGSNLQAKRVINSNPSWEIASCHQQITLPRNIVIGKSTSKAHCGTTSTMPTRKGELDDFVVASATDQFDTWYAIRASGIAASACDALRSQHMATIRYMVSRYAIRATIIKRPRRICL